MLLTTEILRHYQRCIRHPFLDVYGDPAQRDLQSEFRLKLQKDRLARQQLILAGQPYHQPNFPKGDWIAGAKATWELMQQGVDCIYRGVLLLKMDYGQQTTSPTKITLMSRPDLLIKQPGESIFGDWVYVPSDIQLGKRAKQEYQIVAAFHAQLLAAAQGVWPETVWLQLRDSKVSAVNLAIRVPQMQAILEECIQMLLARQEPEVFITRHRCHLCPWLSHCYTIAQSQHHLSLMAGITPSRYKHLQAIQLTTVESLANADLTQLELAFGNEVAQQLVQQAQSVIQNQPILRDASTQVMDSSQPLICQPANLLTTTAPIEIYFDIEAEPELELDYLLGVLVVDRQAKTWKFHSFLAEKPTEEEAIWKQFLDLVSAYPDAPIFHFCDYEVQAVKRLAKCYKTPQEQVKPVLSRFVDIHEWVKQTVTLPVESYALKPIARWLGFEWRDPQANGSQSICWYDQWLETGERHYLEAILRYNEDDCRATYHLKDWLVNFLQNRGQKEFTPLPLADEPVVAGSRGPDAR